MTELTAETRSASTKLDLLHALGEDLERDEYDRLRAFLLGALAAEVSDEVWDSCLSTALDCVEDDRARRAHPTSGL